MYAANGNDVTKWQQPNHHGPVSYTFSPAFHTAECGLWWGLLLVALVYVFRQRHTISNSKTWLIVFGLLVVILLNSLQTSAFVVYALQPRHSISFLYLLNVFCFHISRDVFMTVFLAAIIKDWKTLAGRASRVVVGPMLMGGLVMDYKFLVDYDVLPDWTDWPGTWFLRAGNLWLAYLLAMNAMSGASIMKTAPQEEHLLHKAGQGSGSDTKAKRTSLRRALFGVAVCAVISMVIGMAVGVAVLAVKEPVGVVVREDVGEALTIVGKDCDKVYVKDGKFIKKFVRQGTDVEKVFGNDGKVFFEPFAEYPDLDEALAKLGKEVGGTGDKLGKDFDEASRKMGKESLEAFGNLGMEDGAIVERKVFTLLGVLASKWIGVTFGVMFGVAAFLCSLMILHSFGVWLAPTIYQRFPILCQLSFFVSNFVFVVHVARTVQAAMTTPQLSGTMEAKVEREKCD